MSPDLYFSAPVDAVTDGPAKAVPTITPDGALGYTLCATVTGAEAGSLPGDLRNRRGDGNA